MGYASNTAATVPTAGKTRVQVVANPGLKSKVAVVDAMRNRQLIEAVEVRAASRVSPTRSNAHALTGGCVLPLARRSSRAR